MLSHRCSVAEVVVSRRIARAFSQRSRRSRASTTSFTGSSSSLKCSSIATGGDDPAGGFDAVIGNPPWDALRADTGEPEQSVDASARRSTRGSASSARPGSIAIRGRALQSLSALSRTSAAADAPRRPHRAGPAVWLRDGSRERTASARAARSDDHRSRDRLRQPRGIFPIHRDVKFLLLTGDEGRAHGPSRRDLRTHPAVVARRPA